MTASGRLVALSSLQLLYYAAATSGFFQFRRLGLVIRPILIAFALTLSRTICPLSRARTFWMFGRNLRAVMPVTLVPTPPRYLALPRWVIWFPNVVFLPVKWQTRGMVDPNEKSKSQNAKNRK